MAQPATIPFGKTAVLIGDGATPEVFSAPCGFTNRALRINATTGDTDVPDCDDGDAPIWTQKQLKSQSWQVTGQGVLAQSAHKTWRAWALGGGNKNVRIQFAVPAASGGGYYMGSAILTAFEVTAEHGEKVTASVTVDGDGPLTWVDAAA